MPPMTPDLLSKTIRKSMVIIRIQPRLPFGEQSVDTDEAAVTVSGIIILCTSQFSYVIADSRDFRGKIGPRQRISVVFPDGKEYWIQSNEIRLEGDIVGISIRLRMSKFNTSEIKGIQLCEEPLRNCQQIKMYTAANQNLTPGSIMLWNDENFQHNCSGTYDSECGAAVINSNGLLIGMNVFFQSDYLTAITTRSIAQLIDRSEERDFTTIQNTLQHLQKKYR